MVAYTSKLFFIKQAIKVKRVIKLFMKKLGLISSVVYYPRIYPYEHFFLVCTVSTTLGFYRQL